MKNFYLLYSDDKGIINNEIDDFKKKLSIDESAIVNYNIEDIENIVNEALTVGMFSLNKLIIIDSTNYLYLKKNIDNIKLLEDYFNDYNVNNYLIFISNSSSIDSKKNIVKLISSKGEIKKLSADDSYVNEYVKNYLNDNGYKISNSTMSYFISRVGNNIDNITNELDKLMLYKIDSKVIENDDITLLVDENIDNTVFDLVDSILKNDGNKAIKLYNKFLLDGIDNSQIIGLLANQ